MNQNLKGINTKLHQQSHQEDNQENLHSLLQTTLNSIRELQAEKNNLLLQIDAYKEKLGKNYKLRLRLGKDRRDELNYQIQLLRKDIKRIDTKLVLLGQSMS